MKNARVVRRVFYISDHYLAVAKIQVELKWIKREEVRMREESELTAAEERRLQGEIYKGAQKAERGTKRK